MIPSVPDFDDFCNERTFPIGTLGIKDKLTAQVINPKALTTQAEGQLQL